MWLMLQQNEPDDFVCSTGVSHTVRDLVEYVFDKLDLDWKNKVPFRYDKYFKGKILIS